MIDFIICFALGFFAGSICGVICLALVSGGREDDEEGRE